MYYARFRGFSKTVVSLSGIATPTGYIFNVAAELSRSVDDPIFVSRQRRETKPPFSPSAANRFRCFASRATRIVAGKRKRCTRSSTARPKAWGGGESRRDRGRRRREKNKFEEEDKCCTKEPSVRRANPLPEIHLHANEFVFTFAEVFDQNATTTDVASFVSGEKRVTENRRFRTLRGRYRDKHGADSRVRFVLAAQTR